jgi:DNA replication and repair protein RecF
VREGAQPVSALGYWTGELARAGAPLVHARLRHLRRLAPLMASEYTALAGEQEPLEVDYLAKRYLLTDAMGDEAEGVGWGTAGDEPSALRASLLHGLHDAAAEEVARGMTVVGPHRDDVRLRVGGREARVFASQGEQRSAMLSWKLAEVTYITQCTGSPPLLLLDDVLSELDSRRRTALLLALARAGQTLVTTCEPSDLPESWQQHGARWRVLAGVVTRDA